MPAGEYKDKEKRKKYLQEYNKQWREKNREKACEYLKNWRKLNKERIKKYNKEVVEDGHYSVYLLPNENYVGQTKKIKVTISQHKNLGRDTSNYKILHTFATREEALAKEKEYHDKGYNG